MSGLVPWFSFVLSVFAVNVFFLNPALADPPQDRIPVEIEIDPETLAGLTPEQKEDLVQIKAIMERRLSTWTNLPIDLPETVFQEEGDAQIIEIGNLFQAPNNEEVRELARENGETVPLTPEQLTQVRQKGVIVVPSKKYPGQNYVWRFTTFFQTGKEQIHFSLRKAKTRALSEIHISLPARFAKHEDIFSIRRGLRNLWGGVREAAGLFVGFHAKDRKYSSAEVEALIAQERKDNLAGLSPTPNPRDGNPGLDLRLFDDKLMEKIAPIVARIQKETTEAWAEHAPRRIEVAAEALRAAGVEDSKLVTAVNAALQDQFQWYFQDRIAPDERLEELSPGIGKLLVNHAKAVRIVFEAEQSIQAEAREHEKSILERLNGANKAIQSANEAQKQADEIGTSYQAPRAVRNQLVHNQEEATRQTGIYRSALLQRAYDALPGKLRAAGLEQEAYLLEQDLKALRGHLVDRSAELSEEQEASRTFVHARRIWRKSQWKVEKDEKSGRYTLKRHTVREVDTATRGWRWLNFYQRSVSYFKGATYGVLVHNLWNGPVGLRSQFSRKPFTTDWTVNSETGEIIPANADVTGTYASRISGFYEARRRILDEHAAKNDYGIFGKKLERLGLVFKADLGLGFIAPLFLGVAQPTVTLVNTALSASIAGTAVVWAPLTSLLQLGFNAVIFDTDQPKEFPPTRFFPIVSRLLVQTGILGLGETAGSLAGTIYHPIMAAGNYGLGKASQGIKVTKDKLFYQAIRRWARIPGRDSKLFIRLVKGPGLSNDFFFQVSPDLVMVALQAQLESDHVQIYADEVKAKIDEPTEGYNEFVKIFGLLVGADIRYNEKSPSYAEIGDQRKALQGELDEKMKKRRELYGKLMNVPDRGSIRLSKQQLNETLAKATALNQKFYTELFEEEGWDAKRIEQFWEDKKLNAGDWLGLAKANLTAIFRPGFLTSLEETDELLRLDVQPDTLADYAESLEKGLLPDDLERARVIVEAQASANADQGPEYNLAPGLLVGPNAICEWALIKR